MKKTICISLLSLLFTSVTLAAFAADQGKVPIDYKNPSRVTVSGLSVGMYQVYCQNTVRLIDIASITVTVSNPYNTIYIKAPYNQPSNAQSLNLFQDGTITYALNDKAPADAEGSLICYYVKQ